MIKKNINNTALVGLTRNELETAALEWGEKSFRGRQLFSWIYQRKATSFDEMTNISRELRTRLSGQVRIGRMQVIERSLSPASGSIKYCFQLDDGHQIESVYIPDGDRRTVCISSQVGCALNCSFCATGRMGFLRNLDAGEIVDQVLQVERDRESEMTNVVFMGMGEPFLNYDAVLKAAGLINNPEGLAIGARHITLSTAGILPAMERYTREGHRYKLALSLHSVDQAVRERLMPIARTYPLSELRHTLKHYAVKSGIRPTLELVLIDGINDRDHDASELRRFVQGIPCKINLIPYNPVDTTYKRPRVERVQRFAELLADIHAPVTVRWSRGDDIDAACGQLAIRSKNQNRPSPTGDLHS